MPSYSPVFSAPFIQYTPSNPVASFEVPAGFTAVVRQISIAQEIAITYAVLQFQDSIDAPELSVWIGEPGDIPTYVAQEGRWVLPENGIMTIEVFHLGTEPSIYVGGYLLRNNLT